MGLHDPRPAWTPERRAKMAAVFECKRAERIAAGWIPARQQPDYGRRRSERTRTLAERVTALEQAVADPPAAPAIIDVAAVQAIVSQMLAQQSPRVVVLKPDHRRMADGGRSVKAQVRAARQPMSA